VLVLRQQKNVRNLSPGTQLKKSALDLPCVAITREAEVTNEKFPERMRIFHQI
jgi:hypothetical protein